MKFVETPEPIYVETKEEAQAWKEVFSAEPAIGFDTETTGLDIIRDRVKYFSIATEEHRICVPVRLLHEFKDVLEDENIEKRMTNCKYDMHMAANHGVIVRGKISDTIVMDFLLDENRQGRHGLKETAKDYLGLRMASFATVFGNLKGGKNQAVQMLVKMHDCLEASNYDLAVQILAELGKIHSASEEVLDGINKLTASVSKGYSYTVKSLLAIGRKAGMCSKTTGRRGFAVDVAKYMDIIDKDAEVSSDERENLLWVMDEEAVNIDMHEKLLEELTASIDMPEDPLGTIKLVVADYASLDAWASFMLVDVMRDLLAIEETSDEGSMYSLADYYDEWYDDLLMAAWEMERKGFKVNVDKCIEVETDIIAQLTECERAISKKTGKVMNLNSSAQLKEYFYTNTSNGFKDIFGNPVIFWSKGGTGGKKSPSTGVSALEYFAEKGDEVATLILEYRKLKKIQEFVHKFPIDADEEGRIHSSLNIVGARTGRWASRNPNMQNIPSKGELGSLVRSLFIPEKGNTLIVADYGQLEMRIMAHYANEEAMIDAIANDKDLHSMTAALAGGYDYEAVVSAKRKKDAGESLTKEEKALCNVRRNMKAVGFGLNYGIGAVKLGRQLGLNVDEKMQRGRIREKCPEGEQLIKDYFGVYPRIQQYIEDTKQYAMDNMYVQTISGRFRRLPEVNSSQFWIRAKAQRQAANTVIQGSAIDIMNAAVLNIYRNEDFHSLGASILLQVHDELIIECSADPSVVSEVKAIVQEAMENAWKLKVPLEATPGDGPTWEHAK